MSAPKSASASVSVFVSVSDTASILVFCLLSLVSLCLQLFLTKWKPIKQSVIEDWRPQDQRSQDQIKVGEREHIKAIEILHEMLKYLHTSGTNFAGMYRCSNSVCSWSHRKKGRFRLLDSPNFQCTFVEQIYTSTAFSLVRVMHKHGSFFENSPTIWEVELVVIFLLVPEKKQTLFNTYFMGSCAYFRRANRSQSLRTSSPPASQQPVCAKI